MRRDALTFAKCSASRTLRRSIVRWSLFCLVLPCACNSSNDVGEVRGKIDVDGTPVDVGTIQFKPADNPAARGAGTAINDGQFDLGANHGLKPGRYLVFVQASRKTGKTYQDPQRGPIPEIAPIDLKDSSQQIELTHADAAQLHLTFTFRAK